MNQKPNKWRWAVMAVTALAAYVFIAHRLVVFTHWPTFFASVWQNPLSFTIFATALLLLAALNVLCETAKWHALIGTVNKQPFGQSVRQTLGGMAIGAITPARLGEPAGKLIGIPPNKRVWALTWSLAGSLLHNMVILTCGIAALVWAWHNDTPLPFSLRPLQLSWTLAAAALAPVIVLALLFRPFAKWFIRRFKMHRVVAGFKSQAVIAALGATALRYLCYSSQLALALSFFVPQLETSSLVALIPLYFLGVTLVPSFILADIGIRGSIAIVLFAPLTDNAPGLLSAALSVWVANIVLPAMAGWLFACKRPKQAPSEKTPTRPQQKIFQKMRFLPILSIFNRK